MGARPVGVPFVAFARATSNPVTGPAGLALMRPFQLVAATSRNLPVGPERTAKALRRHEPPGPLRAAVVPERDAETSTR